MPGIGHGEGHGSQCVFMFVGFDVSPDMMFNGYVLPNVSSKPICPFDSHLYRRVHRWKRPPVALHLEGLSSSTLRTAGPVNRGGALLPMGRGRLLAGLCFGSFRRCREKFAVSVSLSAALLLSCGSSRGLQPGPRPSSCTTTTTTIAAAAANSCCC